MSELTESEKSILRNALSDYAFSLRTIHYPNAPDRVLYEDDFLTNPDVSETRKSLYLRALGLRAEIDNLFLK